MHANLDDARRADPHGRRHAQLDGARAREQHLGVPQRRGPGRAAGLLGRARRRTGPCRHRSSRRRGAPPSGCCTDKFGVDWMVNVDAPARRSCPVTFLQPHDRVLLTGDSVTDWGRDRSDPTSLGHGYAGIVAALAGARRPDLGLTFLNRGVGGDTSAMLRARWEQDAVALAPTVVSILIGINDTWRRYDAGTPTSTGRVRGQPARGRRDGRPPGAGRAVRRAGDRGAARVARGPGPADRGGAPARRRAARACSSRPTGCSPRRPPGPGPRRGRRTACTRRPRGTGCSPRRGSDAVGSRAEPSAWWGCFARAPTLTLASWPIVSRSRGPRSRPTDGPGGRSDARAHCRSRRPRARPRGAALLSLSVERWLLLRARTP